MDFSLLPPEVNSALMHTGAGSGPSLAAAAAWDGIGNELSSTAEAFDSVTSNLATEAWQGEASSLMKVAAATYGGWLAAAAAQADESASGLRAAVDSFETAHAAVVHPSLVTANRGQLVALVRSNLFGQNAPAVAEVESAYEQMWAQDVSAMAGYHASASAVVSQLGSWGQALETMPGLPGAAAATIANTPAAVQQEVSHVFNSIETFIFGSPPTPPIPARQGGTFGGTPSLTTRLEVPVLHAVKDITGAFGIDASTQLAPLIASASPPKILAWVLGETVQQTTYDGMTVWQITPSHPSGHYVVAIHGGAYEVQPTILHWLDYTLMAHQTGATIEVPIYPLVQQGGTAAKVVPAIAGLISMEITQHGASNVSVYGDSAGGGIALSAVEYMVANNMTVPASMVLLSPTLELAMTNPNIAFVNDPLLTLAAGQKAGQAWAGNLPMNDYLVSPLYGSLKGLPPTDVYSGSLDLLAPDVLVLQQEAATQGAPLGFVLLAGLPHDWALAGIGDHRYRPQIYQELGL